MIDWYSYIEKNYPEIRDKDAKSAYDSVGKEEGVDIFACRSGMMLGVEVVSLVDCKDRNTYLLSKDCFVCSKDNFKIKLLYNVFDGNGNFTVMDC